MLAGSPATLIYKHDRRAHRHRCRACWKAVNEGDAVIMAKVADRVTWVIHEECGDKRHSDAYSWREVMAAWSGDHKRRLSR